MVRLGRWEVSGAATLAGATVRFAGGVARSRQSTPRQLEKKKACISGSGMNGHGSQCQWRSHVRLESSVIDKLEEQSRTPLASVEDIFQRLLEQKCFELRSLQYR